MNKNRNFDAGCRRFDRHANLRAGTIDPAALVAVVQAAGATVICETPDAPGDVGWLRTQLPAG